jgi:hypothetical protein
LPAVAGLFACAHLLNHLGDETARALQDPGLTQFADDRLESAALYGFYARFFAVD